MDNRRPRVQRRTVPVPVVTASVAPAAPADPPGWPLPIALGGRRQCLRRQRRRRHWLKAPAADEARAGR